jgi:hypothetical protein
MMKMLDRTEAMGNLLEFDMMRAGLEPLAADHPVSVLTLKICELGEKCCTQVLDMYRQIDDDNSKKAAMEEKYVKEIEPLIKKWKSLSRLLAEECSKFIGVNDAETD